MDTPYGSVFIKLPLRLPNPNGNGRQLTDQ